MALGGTGPRGQIEPRVTVPTLTFLGATRTVTGSRFLIRHGDAAVLVDCGMFQGRRSLRDLNWSQPPFDPSAVDAVVLTHAHLDHVGWLPVLARRGFAGRVFSASWTPELARIVLSDSGHLQEKEAAFANRTEVLLAALGDLARAGQIPELPVYVDSPMASAVLAVYRRAMRAADPEVRPGTDPDRALDAGGEVHESTTREQSIAIDEMAAPSIVISSSGMATGGRVLHHLARRLPDPRSTVILAGYQAEGTRGRSLADGARAIKFHGHYVPVRAQVVNIDAFSVHADSDELVAWMASHETAPETTFVVHGEEASSEALSARIDSELGRLAVVPSWGETVRLA